MKKWKRIGKFYIQEVEHHGSKWKVVKFKYCKKKYQYLRNLSNEGVRWSKVYKCFLLPSYMNINILKKDDLHLTEDVAPLREKPSLEVFLREKEKEDQGEKEGLKTEIKKNGFIENGIHKMEDWMQYRQYSKVTIKTYVSMVTTFLYKSGVKAGEDISYTSISEYVNKRKKDGKWSTSAQNQFVSGMKIFVSINECDELDTKSLIRPRRGRRLPSVLSEEEVTKILRSVINIKHYCLLSLVYSSGLRIGEALSLELKHVVPEEGVIYIQSGKGDRDRRVPLSQRAEKVIVKYIKAYKPQKYLFEAMEKGKPYSMSSSRKVLQKAVSKAGIKRKVTLHTLRHSYATHLLERGVGLRYIQEVLGHKDPKTTMLYTHVSGKKIREIRSPLDDLDL